MLFELKEDILKMSIKMPAKMSAKIPSKMPVAKTDLKGADPEPMQECGMIESIINGMYDWVRVIDMDNNVIFMNKAMSEGLINAKTGMKCYAALGRSAPCGNCPSHKAAHDGRHHRKEETINGRIYSVMSSPVRNKERKIEHVVEVLRDVTETKEMHEKILAQNRKLEFELSIARKLQCSLLPETAEDDRLEFRYIYKPCDSLGGDFIDTFKIDADHTGIYIADISGHGVPASMLTVFLRSSMDRRALSPAAALSSLYNEFNKNGYGGELYITVFYAIINLKTKTLAYSNAGHNVCPVVYNNYKNKFTILRSAGIPISNWVEKPSYEDRFLQLEKHDRLFMYTDGITNVKNKEGMYFEEETLLEILLKENGHVSETLDRIIDRLYQFTGRRSFASLPDDITLALAELL